MSLPVSTVKAARDVVVGDHVSTGTLAGPAAKVENANGVIYIWLESHPTGLSFEQRGAEIILNHGDPIRVRKDNVALPTRAEAAAARAARRAARTRSAVR